MGLLVAYSNRVPASIFAAGCAGGAGKAAAIEKKARRMASGDGAGADVGIGHRTVHEHL